MLRFTIFCGLLLLVVWAKALTSYFVWHSIHEVIVAMVASLLLLQWAYIASLLFSIWQSSRNCRSRQRARRSDHR